MLIVFVRFSRNSQSDDDAVHAGNNFPHLNGDLRLQLLEQFKLELYENHALRGYWTTLHSYDTMDGVNEPSFFIWVKFSWPGTLSAFTKTLQACYEEHGMAGDWNIVDAVDEFGIVSHEAIVAAVKEALSEAYGMVRYRVRLLRVHFQHGVGRWQW